MAKPRVFVSSTYYDLKHFRASLDIFIERLGFESILSEKGNIAYNPDQPLDAIAKRRLRTFLSFLLVDVTGRKSAAKGKSQATNSSSGMTALRRKNMKAQFVETYQLTF